MLFGKHHASHHVRHIHGKVLHKEGLNIGKKLLFTIKKHGTKKMGY